MEQAENEEKTSWNVDGLQFALYNICELEFGLKLILRWYHECKKYKFNDGMCLKYEIL